MRLRVSNNRDSGAQEKARRASIRGVFAMGVEPRRLLVALILLLPWPYALLGAPIPVRFLEGSVHAFLALRTVDGTLLASGDTVQINRGATVESRMAFQFKDGSIFDERFVFSQQRVFKLEK
jgi:hypothetical protein